ncbi:hypothetical protein [Pseudomonas sp. NPDC008258]|uniref:hypothetical protein n=1 Tax=Pseudomonas sp. NPDC008258 TaxID=3364418 RepID=UPI0036E29DB6
MAALTLSSRITEETRNEAMKTFCEVADMLDQAIKLGESPLISRTPSTGSFGRLLTS